MQHATYRRHERPAHFICSWQHFPPMPLRRIRSLTWLSYRYLSQASMPMYFYFFPPRERWLWGRITEARAGCFSPLSIFQLSPPPPHRWTRPGLAQVRSFPVTFLTPLPLASSLRYFPFGVLSVGIRTGLTETPWHDGIGKVQKTGCGLWREL
ncbi:hypothetical protein B0H63DRAFT_247282 [Podospora didyma]|uniref:Uncharacterized protein n=1 Tax=Podospora didyma TaxID=330526 RepID=A0AAE0NCK1_9PEZI|nr:hypothetical protein B0H63DRAFT_247282 [Podospora didyma]